MWATIGMMIVVFSQMIPLIRAGWPDPEWTLSSLLDGLIALFTEKSNEPRPWMEREWRHQRDPYIVSVWRKKCLHTSRHILSSTVKCQCEEQKQTDVVAVTLQLSGV